MKPKLISRFLFLFLLLLGFCSYGYSQGNEKGGGSGGGKESDELTDEELQDLVDLLGYEFFDPEERVDYQYFHVPGTRLEMAMPDSWSAEDEPTEYGEALLWRISPYESLEDEFRENIDFTDDVSSGDLDDDFEAQLRPFSVFMEDYHVIEKGKRKVNGIPMRYVYHEYTLGVTVRSYQCFYKVKDRLYILTCTASPESMDAFFPIFEYVSNSLRFE